MPYLVTTNKPSSSALHCVSGLFFGCEGVLGDSVSVVVNHGTRISIYETRRRSNDESQKHHDFALVSDVPVNGTVRLMESLPIVDPSTGSVTRHILFLLTEKQDYLLLAFDRSPPQPEDGDDAAPLHWRKPIVVHCMFTGTVESLFFQGHINGEECSAATGNDFVARCTTGKPLQLFPIVCFSIFSGTIFIVDVAAAIAEGAQRPNAGAWRHVLPDGFWSFVVEPRVGLAACNIRNVEESTFSSLSWATLSPAATSNIQMTLYVLYVDRRSRSHVAEYALDLVPQPAASGRPDARGGAAAAPALALILSATVGQTIDSPKSIVNWRRSQTLQSDVEADATLLHAVKSGVVVIGPQLVTFISSSNVAKSSRRANVVTATMPQATAGQGGASKHPAEPRCVSSIDGNNFVVALGNGALVHVELRPTLEEWESALLPNVEEEIKEVICSLRATTAAVPECMTYFSAGYCFVGSHYSNSVLVDLRNGEATIVIDNIGPILDMVVVEDGPRMLVVASTGLNRNGALQLLRSAVSLVEEAVIPEMESVRRVYAAGPFVCLSLLDGSRILRCSESPSGMVLEELGSTEFDEAFETICFGLLCPTSLDYIQVTHSRVIVVRDGPSRQVRQQWDSPSRIQDAFSFPWGCCVCAGSIIYIFSANGGATPSVTLRCTNEVACAVLTPAGELFVGEWTSNSIKYRRSASATAAQDDDDVKDVIATFDGVPRSLQVTHLSGGSARYIFASFPDGTVTYGKILEACDHSPISVILSIIKISSQPVGLTLVEAVDCTVAVLCTGDVPSVMYESHGRVQVTGVALQDVESYATLRAGGGGQLARSICFSRSDSTIRIGRVGSAQRISKTTLEVKQTVSKVAYLAPWRCFAAALRMRDRDDIFLYSLASLEAPSRAASSSVQGPPLPLMEAERCVFIECLAMGGPAASLSEVAPLRTKAEWTANNGADLMNHFQCVLIGTSFVFPEESTARSSRLVWATAEPREGQGMMLAPLGEKDIVGALSSCCMVPNCPGRIALGINGSIHLFRWNALERDLVAEANVVVGSLLMQVVPVFPKDCRKTGILVAGDCRYSVVAVRVNVVDSAMEVMCRDLALRPVMSLVVADHSVDVEPLPVTDRPTLQGRDIVFSDEHLNLFSVEQTMTAKTQDADRAAAARTRRRSGADDEDDDASAPPDSSPDDEKPEQVTYVPGKSFHTTSQVHLGDRVTCLRVGTFAALPNLWANLVPGAKGQQLVFGTCHGALGSIIALDGLVFTFLTLFERSIQELVSPVGGLSTMAYREILARGKQKRKVALGSAMASSTYDARGFCDGDVIESFLELPSQYQEKVATVLNEKFVVKVADGGDGFPAVERRKKSISEQLLATGEPVAQRDAAAALQPPTEQQLDDAVELIVQRGLPPYPFTAAALSNLVSDLSRAH